MLYGNLRSPVRVVAQTRRKSVTTTLYVAVCLIRIRCQKNLMEINRFRVIVDDVLNQSRESKDHHMS